MLLYFEVNLCLLLFSVPDVHKVSQPDNEHGAVENRDPNKHQAAGMYLNTLT